MMIIPSRGGPLDNMPARSSVIQRAGPVAPDVIPLLAQRHFTFYATFTVESLCSAIPTETAVLLPASSWARVGMRPPRLPAHITERAADSGGFVASCVWGDYRYSLDQYAAWLATWQPCWAATMDYCCEPELQQITRERQDKTTANVWLAWERYRNVPWAWVPTLQGWRPDDYHQHACELKPLIEAMQAQYAGSSSWRVGVGTLCRRNDVTVIQAILDAIRDVLPDVPLHLWGIKLDALSSIALKQVISSDSAVWHGLLYRSREVRAEARAAGMSTRTYTVSVNLPHYTRKVYAAVAESVRTFEAEAECETLALARDVLKAQGWTLHVRARRNRSYAYAARRNGNRLRQRYLCPIADLPSWLEQQSTYEPLSLFL